MSRAFLRAAALCITLCSLAGAAYTDAVSLDVFRQNRTRIQSQACSLARQAAAHYLRYGTTEFKGPDLPEIFNRKAAVFVTISKDGQRRGCRGSFEPAEDTLKAEIIRVAIEAATADIRYRPIRLGELDELAFSVSIVGEPEIVSDLDGFCPTRCGLLLRSGEKSGVLLPGEAKTNTWQLAEAKRQAGVQPGEPYELYVFETVALHETRPPEAK